MTKPVRERAATRFLRWEERVVTRFLWWPLTVGLETRWLEWATLRQSFYVSYFVDEWLTVEFLPGAPHHSHLSEPPCDS